uniref:Protein fem-1 homolog C-like n=1 Tax=Hirondellea gigas TaxID=1518452 RepID=A0A2P2HXM9_9CRUS
MRKRMMWMSKEEVGVCKKQMFNDLCIEIKSLSPGSRLTFFLRNKIEKCPKSDRQEIVNKTSSGCTPLFLACMRGLSEVVEYLCSQCEANLELKGFYEVPDDRSVHYVTPLWCAAVAGKKEVVQVLIDHGANINSVSDTGSTSVRSACFMTHIDIVKYLVEKGANVLKPNFNGGTCLINSVQSVALCKFLLDHGAHINAQDIKCKTALHYAIEEHRLETVKLLLDRGADPSIRSRLNDDAIQTACIKGAYPIFNYLIKFINVSMHEVADGYELIGSTFLDEHHDIQEAIIQWKRAASIRELYSAHKERLPRIKPFGFAKEFETVKELEIVLLDQDSIRVQSLLISQRVLGPTHKDSIFRLMYRGAAYADTGQYQKCVRLWLYALELRINKDTILYNEVFFTSHAIVKLFLDIVEKHPPNVAAQIILFEDAFHALKLIGEEIGPSQWLLSIRPQFKRQLTNFDLALNVFLHFTHVVLKTVLNEQQNELLHRYMRSIVKLNPHTVEHYTMLHLSVNKSSLNSANILTESDQRSPFPSFEVTKLLLECGASVNASSDNGATPIYLACFKANLKVQIIRLLLANDAHIDQGTTCRDSAYHLLLQYAKFSEEFITLPVLALKCLSARAIRDAEIKLRPGEIPVELEKFVAMH